VRRWPRVTEKRVRWSDHSQPKKIRGALPVIAAFYLVI
jgi:hypothetical protein